MLSNTFTLESVQAKKWSGDITPIKDFYDSVAYQWQPSEDEKIFVATMTDNIIGIARLCSEEGFLVLRGMQVGPAYQGKGAGRLLLTELIKYIPAGVPCWGIPYEHLEDFYKNGAFTFVDEKIAPAHLQERIKAYRIRNKDKHYRIMYREPISRQAGDLSL